MISLRSGERSSASPQGHIRYAARGAVMDVVVWLRSLGLAEYETAFRENKIDEGVLPKLTAEDLKELGVSALGDRRKLLDAIAALRTDAGVKAPSVEPATPKQQETAERRQVTVMFSDLVGSTALSARMDPEDLREVISAYQKCVADTVSRFGGFVAKYMGDGVLIYFGYPQAHEDDAERAVRAGLELVTAVANLNTDAPLQTRVGIATGLVVVGDLIGSGALRSKQSLARPRTLRRACKALRSRTASSLLKAHESFSAICSSLRTSGQRTLKASPDRCTPGRRCERASVEGRFEALHASGLTALVGREEEFELLLRRWSQSQDRRRPSGAPVRRGGYRQVAAHRRAAGMPRRRAAYAPALFLLAAAHGQRTLSDHRPDGTRRRPGARRQTASEARQARYSARADLDLDPGRRALCRDAVAAERWTISGACVDPGTAPAKNAGSVDRATCGDWQDSDRC